MLVFSLSYLDFHVFVSYSSVSLLLYEMYEIMRRNKEKCLRLSWNSEKIYGVWRRDTAFWIIFATYFEAHIARKKFRIFNFFENLDILAVSS